MSAPHEITYNVLFKGEQIDEFTIDVDLDLPNDIYEELRKEFKRSWFDAKVLFRLCEHLYYGTKADFVIEEYYHNMERGELRLVITDIRDWG